MRQREKEEQGTLSCALNFDALVFVLVVVIILGLRGTAATSTLVSSILLLQFCLEYSASFLMRLIKFSFVLQLLCRKFHVPLMIVHPYSTSSRNGNRANGNHLDICLLSSQKNRNSRTWVLVALTVCFTYPVLFRVSAESRAGEWEL